MYVPFVRRVAERYSRRKIVVLYVASPIIAIVVDILILISTYGSTMLTGERLLTIGLGIYFLSIYIPCCILWLRCGGHLPVYGGVNIITIIYPFLSWFIVFIFPQIIMYGDRFFGYPKLLLALVVCYVGGAATSNQKLGGVAVFRGGRVFISGWFLVFYNFLLSLSLLVFLTDGFAWLILPSLYMHFSTLLIFVIFAIKIEETTDDIWLRFIARRFFENNGCVCLADILEFAGVRELSFVDLYNIISRVAQIHYHKMVIRATVELLFDGEGEVVGIDGVLGVDRPPDGFRVIDFCIMLPTGLLYGTGYLMEAGVV